MTYTASLECDGNYGVCPARIDCDTAAKARQEAREIGWQLGKRGDFCPYCQQSPYRMARSAKLNKSETPFRDETTGDRSE